MALVQACVHEDLVMTYDTDDVESYSLANDLVGGPSSTKLAGTTRLTLNFRTDKRPLWATREDSIMQPTVGRIVLVPIEPSKNNGSPIAPAIITRVWSPTSVNVRVLADSMNLLWLTSLTYVESLDDASPQGLWTWPPRI